MQGSSNVDESLYWQAVGWVTLCIRFVQGWIYWAGGSRRLIYAPSKLDPFATNWLANKLQSAMPGALLGLGHAISFLLHHFWVLYISLVLFSLLELLSGIGLIIGFFTRLCAFFTAIISVILMLIFGWEGGTCLDEWTIGVSSFSMALVLMLSGSTVYSLDGWLLGKYPSLNTRSTFVLLASGNRTPPSLKLTATIFFLIAVLFTTVTYNYYRGAIFSGYHAGPVSPTVFQLNLSQGQIDPNGNLKFKLYVSAGQMAVPTHIMRVELQRADGKVIEVWTAQELSALSSKAIVNSYSYNQIKTSPYGLMAPESAKAWITLKGSPSLKGVSKGEYVMYVYTINGKKWSLPIVVR